MSNQLFDFVCPFCKAPKGRPCVTRTTGFSTWTHQGRHDLYQRFLKKSAEETISAARKALAGFRVSVYLHSGRIISVIVVAIDTSGDFVRTEYPDGYAGPRILSLRREDVAAVVRH